MVPGATVGVLGTGVPRLACLRPAAGLSSGPVRHVFINKRSRPLQGAKPRGADDTRPPQEWPHQAGSRGAERSRQGGTSRGSHDVSHDDQGQAGASDRIILVSSSVLRRQAQSRSTEASSKGFNISATRPRLAGRQDRGHRGAHNSITTRAFGRRRPPLVRIACTSCPLSNWPLWHPFPLNIWEEDQGLYK